MKFNDNAPEPEYEAGARFRIDCLDFTEFHFKTLTAAQEFMEFHHLKHVDLDEANELRSAMGITDPLDSPAPEFHAWQNFFNPDAADDTNPWAHEYDPDADDDDEGGTASSDHES
jgi:hypothetical protein